MSSTLQTTNRNGRGAPWAGIGLALAVGAGTSGYFYAYRPLEQRAHLQGERAEALAAELAETKRHAALADKELATQTAALAELRSELERSRADQAESERVLVELKQNLKQTGVEIRGDKGRITVTLVDRVLFRSGRADVTPAGERVLTKLGVALKGLTGKTVQVSGHTDEMPIGQELSKPFPTNWELSAARATNVVRYLEEQAGVHPGMLMAAGYGPNRPVASNQTAKGRAKNRRIEILLLPQAVEMVRRPIETQITQSDAHKSQPAVGVFGPVR